VARRMFGKNADHQILKAENGKFGKEKESLTGKTRLD
jgi:hypothetical protein